MVKSSEITSPSPSNKYTNCKLQLAYPATSVEPLSTINNVNNTFYYFTSNAPFNLSFVDGSDNVYLSGLSTKGVIHSSLHKGIYNGKGAELTIVHKSNSSTIYLCIPLVYDPRAKSTLSSYLDGNKKTTIDLGSDIGNSDVVYYKSSTGTEHVFVVQNGIAVSSVPNNLSASVFDIQSITQYADGSYAKLIKNPDKIDDEVVCDYEGDGDADANKPAETKKDEWAATIVMILGIIGLSVAYMIMNTLPNEPLLKTAGVLGLIGLVAGITLSVLADKGSNKSKFSGFASGAMISWMLFLMSVWFGYKSYTPTP
jgi:hypothetical protein